MPKIHTLSNTNEDDCCDGEDHQPQKGMGAPGIMPTKSHFSGGGSDKVWIYHERQESALCGNHSLNNLLQAPVFSPVDLAEIAEQLDANERSIMGQSVRGMYEPSGNVDESGNFSIQVLRAAVQNSHGLELVSWAGESERKVDPVSEKGIIVNRSQHWFCIRKINNRWWNLNSTMNYPEEVSDFYLGAFLSQLRNDGYSVFVAKGNLLPGGTKDPRFDHVMPASNASWYTEKDLLSGHAMASGDSVNNGEGGNKTNNSFQAFQGQGRRLGGEQASVPIPTQAIPGIDMMTEEEQLEAAIAASLGNTVSPPPHSMSNNNNNNNNNNSVFPSIHPASSMPGSDPDLELALALSRQEAYSKQETEEEKKAKMRAARLAAFGAKK